MTLINIGSLSFEYTKGNIILNNISAKIEENSINVILGLNGCGKTTLIKLLAGLMKQQSGVINVAGKPVLAMTDHERSKLISYVPQVISSRIAFTVAEYLLLALSNQKSFLWRSSHADKKKVKEFASHFSISREMLDQRVDELSGGQRQIVMICGAVMQDSKIIILDEPTAALDLKNQHLVLKFLKQCKKDGNKTIIFTCHDPNHALRLGGNTIALHHGEIFLQGESREILKAENLQEIYGSVVDAKDSKYNFITFDW